MPRVDLASCIPERSPPLSAIRLTVEYQPSGCFLALPVPDSRIDGGVEEIGDQVGEDDVEDHDDRDRFIQQETWFLREASASRIP